jgi:ribonuclease HI
LEVSKNLGETLIVIYTDGACLGNPGPGGWGAVILENGEKKQLHGSEENTTNNRMEVTAVLEALRTIPRNADVRIFSDSTYVINTMTKNWKRKKNQDLWALLDNEVGPRNVEWEWVKGHSGDRFNEEADQLAYREASKVAKGR